MVRSLAIAAAGVVMLQLLLGIALRDRHKAGLLSTALVLVVLSRPAVLGLARSLGSLPAWQSVAVTILGMLVALGIAFWVGHRNLRPSRITRRLNAFALVMLGVVLVTSIANGSVSPALGDLTYSRQSGPAAAGPSPRRNVYIILLDGYARSDTLATSYGYDNRPFLDGLGARGFDVSAGSRSNYMRTILTLTSMFYMDELPNISKVRALLANDASQGALMRTVRDSPAFSVLRDHGFKTIALGPGYEQSALRTAADTFLDSGNLNEFEVALLRLTLLKDVVQALAPDFPSSQQRDRIQWNLNELAEVAAQPASQPQFVFGHIPSPHTPIVFGANGEPVHATDLDHFYEDRTPSPAEYRGQVEHLNRLVLATLDSIQRKEQAPPIIILMSDHGPGEFQVDLDHPDETVIRTRMRNFFAAYTPDHPDLFGSNPTPVNVLPMLMNAYLGTDLPLADEEFYVSGVDGSLGRVSDPDEALSAPNALTHVP